MVLLREACDGDKGDIEDDIGRKPADGNGKFTEDETAEDETTEETNEETTEEETTAGGYDGDWGLGPVPI